MVLLAMVMLLVIGLGTLGLGLQGRIFSARRASEISARIAADAGLEQAIFEMNEQLKIKPWNDSVLPSEEDQLLSNCLASFSYTATGDALNGYLIQAVGRSQWAQKQVSCDLGLRGPFEAAIFTDNLLTLYNGTTVDWYNYDADDQFLAIGSNSRADSVIELKSGVTINGDVVVGLGSDPDTGIDNHGATIKGRSYALRQKYDLSAIVVPPWLDGLPARLPLEQTTTITTSGKYSGINLKSGKVLTIDGQVSIYCVGDMSLGNKAELRIVDANTNPNASLTLYLGGNYEGKNSSTLNNLSCDPKKLRIYCLDSCTSMKLKNGTTFYGAIYAPKADVDFFNSAAAYGSVTAKNFSQSNSANFYYDASLRDVALNDQAVRFVKAKWDEQ